MSPILAFDSNISEGMIHSCAKGSMLFRSFGSDDGGRAASVVYGITARINANQMPNI